MRSVSDFPSGSTSDKIGTGAFDPLAILVAWCGKESVREVCAEEGPMSAVRRTGEEDRAGFRVGGDHSVTAAEAEREAEVWECAETRCGRGSGSIGCRCEF